MTKKKKSRQKRDPFSHAFSYIKVNNPIEINDLYLLFSVLQDLQMLGKSINLLFVSHVNKNNL